MDRLEANIRKENNAKREILWQSQAEKIELARIKNLPVFKKQKIVDALNVEIFELQEKLNETFDFLVADILMGRIEEKNAKLGKYLFS